MRTDAQSLLLAQAEKGDWQAAFNLVQEYMQAGDFDQAQYWVERGVKNGQQTFIDLKVKVWLANSEGPWPWAELEENISSVVSLNREFYWPLAKVQIFTDGDVRGTLEKGAEGGCNRCRCALAMSLIDEQDVNGAMRNFKLAENDNYAFASWAVQQLSLIHI